MISTENSKATVGHFGKLSPLTSAVDCRACAVSHTILVQDRVVIDDDDISNVDNISSNVAEEHLQASPRQGEQQQKLGNSAPQSI